MEILLDIHVVNFLTQVGACEGVPISSIGSDCQQSKLTPIWEEQGNLSQNYYF